MSGSLFLILFCMVRHAQRLPYYTVMVTATMTPDMPEHFNCGCYYPAILATDSWANKPASLREVNYEKVTELSLHCPHNHGKYRKPCLFRTKISFPVKKNAEPPLSHIFDWCLTMHFMLQWHVSLSHMSNTKLMNNRHTEEMWIQLFYNLCGGWCF